MKKENKEMVFYYNWRGWLQLYGTKKNPNFDIDNYDEEILKDLFANKFTTAKAYRELLSEMPKVKSK